RRRRSGRRRGQGGRQVMRRVVVLACASAIAFGPPAAAGQTTPDEARRLFDEGVLAVGRRDFAAALAAFQTSYDLNPTGTVAFNIALCRRELGDLPGTVSALHRLLDEHAGGASPERLARARELIEEMSPAVGVLRLSVRDPDAVLLLDGREIGVSPFEETLFVEPGRHEVEARWEGMEPERAEIAVPGGAGRAVLLALFRPDVIDTAHAPDADEDESGGGVNEWWLWGTISGAAALGLAAGLTGTFAFLAHEEWEDGGEIDDGLLNRGQSLEISTNVLAACAGAAAAAALVLLFLVDFGPEEPAAESAAPDIALLPGGLVLRW
ncbi:MAG: hypothetical protein QME96_03950, partial [Myxococcota bacterium]|nr:hypothetical protein [Myxococcota bacterium]